MRIGVAPLLLAILVAATRLGGAHQLADLLAYVYLTFFTVMMSRMTRPTAAERARVD